MTDRLCSDKRKIRSYTKLIAQVPLVKALFESGDVESLESLYKNVSGPF
jgi:hypothetical protein